MELYWKCIGGLLLALVLWLTLHKQQPDLSLVLSLAGCTLGAMVVFSFLEPVLELLRELETIGKLENGMLSLLMKVVGIGLTGEIAGMLCADAGNAAFGKILSLLSAVTMLYLSMPLIRTLLQLLQEILGLL